MQQQKVKIALNLTDFILIIYTTSLTLYLNWGVIEKYRDISLKHGNNFLKQNNDDNNNYKNTNHNHNNREVMKVFLNINIFTRKKKETLKILLWGKNPTSEHMIV